MDRLETLAGIVTRGGIARSADGDGNRQSLFSRQIKELEGWFGCDLLDRTVVPARPTAVAERIAASTEAFLRELDGIREEAGGGRKTVVFGAGERMLRGYLIPLTARIRRKNLRLVFRNLNSRSVRAELLAKRVDFGVLRRELCPCGMAFTELPPLRICLLAPRDHPLAGRKWSWQDLARQPLAVLEGDGQLSRFLAEQERATGIRLDVAVGCSTWTQVIDVMREFKLAGILPHDLAKQGPPEYVRVEIGELAAYADRYVIAWPEAEAARREEIARVAESLLGKKRGAG